MIFCPPIAILSSLSGSVGSVHSSANLFFFYFYSSNKNGKRTCYLSLSYLHILKYGKKIGKKKMVRKIDHFFVFLILKLNSKIHKILSTAKSDILLFFIFLLLLENEKNEIMSNS